MWTVVSEATRQAALSAGSPIFAHVELRACRTLRMSNLAANCGAACKIVTHIRFNFSSVRSNKSDFVTVACRAPINLSLHALQLADLAHGV
jgi:hypothetical protein